MTLPSRYAPPVDEPELMLDINTTPLIDVMLVLLIMLIITIPPQLHSVNLDLPQAQTQPPPVPPSVIRIDIDADNQIRWNARLLASPQALQAELQSAAQMQPEPQLHLRAHAQANYGVVVGVMAAAQRQGLRQLGVVGSERLAP
jgi:biopolymer transport protein ExbD